LASVLFILAILFGESIILPGLDAQTIYAAHLKGGTASLSILSLGITPMLSAFYLVELVALLRPRWRALRCGTPEERLRVDRVAYGLALLVAAVQGYFVAVWLDKTGSALPGLLLLSGSVLRALLTLSLAAGVAVSIYLCWVATRYGIVQGFSLWLALAALRGGPAAALWEQLRNGELPAGGMLELVSIVLGLVLLTAWALRPRSRGGLRLPACGLDPVTRAGAVLALPQLLAAIGLGSTAGILLQPGSLSYLGTYLAVTAVLALVLGLLFNLSPAIAQVLAALSPPVQDMPSAPLPGAPTPAEEAIRAARRPALIRSLVFVFLVVLSSFAAQRIARVVFDTTLVVVVTAVALDAIEEWRFRRRHGPLCEVWRIHQLYAVSPALLILQAAGIAAHARSANHRTLLQFFGPFIPVSLLVPEHQAVKAEGLLRRRWPTQPAEPPLFARIAVGAAMLLLIAVMLLAIRISLGPVAARHHG
jgi:preprotein translocase subunit SecY